jgi:hypothetical protein
MVSEKNRSVHDVQGQFEIKAITTGGFLVLLGLKLRADPGKLREEGNGPGMKDGGRGWKVCEVLIGYAINIEQW